MAREERAAEPLARWIPPQEWPLVRRTIAFLGLPLLLAGLGALVVLYLDLGRPEPAHGPGAGTPLSLLTARVLAVEGVGALHKMFAEHGFELDKVGAGESVPRLYLARLPGDILAVDDGDLRKSLFLKAALPLVLLVNETIAAERRRLVELRQKMAAGLGLDADEGAWLADLALRYRAAPERLDDLMARVDVVPPSLALAQAAAESGWGTSRPAREDNALFGEMAWAAELGRFREPSYIVRPFDDLYNGVRAYADNLNSHPAYAEFRLRRAQMRGEGGEPDGYRLALTVRLYSERRDDYIDELRRIIRVNDLTRFDGASLGDRTRAHVVVSRI